MTWGHGTLSYRELDDQVGGLAGGLMALGLDRGERVGIFLDKRPETVTAFFGTTVARWATV